MHPSLVLLAVCFGVLITFSFGIAQVAVAPLKYLTFALTYALGFFSLIFVFLAAGWFDEFAQYSRFMTSWGEERSLSLLGFFSLLSVLAGNLSGYSSVLGVTAFVVLAALYVGWHAFHRQRFDFVHVAAFVLVLTYVLALAGSVSAGFMDRSNAALPRVLLFLLPFVICGSFHLLELNLRTVQTYVPPIPYAPLLAIAFACGWFFLLTSTREYNWAVGQAKGRQTETRAVYDKLKDKVSAGERLLVAGSLTYALRRYFMQEIYFGENARYLLDCVQGDLASFLRKENIRYVFFSRQIDRRILVWPDIRVYDSDSKTYKTPGVKLGICLGFDPTEYTHEAERKRLLNFLPKHGFKRIAVINGSPLFDRGPLQAR
jgi:hypothetical protein